MYKLQSTEQSVIALKAALLTNLSASLSAQRSWFQSDFNVLKRHIRPTCRRLPSQRPYIIITLQTS